MTTHLRKLKIRAIGLVDKGANPGAFIALFKRHTKPEDRLMADEKTAEELLKAATERADKAEAVIAKAKEDADAEAAKIAKEAAGKAEADKKAEGNVQKRITDLEKETKDANAKVEKLETANALRESIEKAAQYGDLFGKPEDFGPLLMKFDRTLDTEGRKQWHEMLSGATKVVKDSKLFAEMGIPGGGSGGNTWEKIEKAAAAKYPEQQDEAQAISDFLATKEGKELNAQYVKELKGE